MDLQKKCALSECEKKPEIGFSFIYDYRRFDHCCDKHMSAQLSRLDEAKVKRRSRNPYFRPLDST